MYMWLNVYDCQQIIWLQIFEATFMAIATCNICPICCHIQDICNRNVHDLDLDVSNGPMLTLWLWLADRSVQKTRLIGTDGR